MPEDKPTVAGVSGETPGSSGAPGPFDLDEWLKAAPPEALKGLGERFAQSADAYLTETYGDLIPVIEEIRTDPKLRGRVAKLYRDGKVDKEELEFLLGTGVDTFEEDIRPRRSVRGGPAHEGSPDSGSPGRARGEDDPLAREVAELKDRLNKDEMASNQKRYEDYRRSEVEALLKEHPELRWEKADESDPNYKRMAHIAEVAENRTKANYDRGVQKVVSYKEVADDLSVVVGLEKPPAAPRTSGDSRIDDKPQAPRTVAESRSGMEQKLAKAGGFRALAEASRRS